MTKDDLFVNTIPLIDKIFNHISGVCNEIEV